MSDWFEALMKLMVVLAMGAGTVVMVRVAVLGGWRRRLGASSDAPPPELAELRQAVDRLTGEVGELQERLDFTERVLAQQRERARLPDQR